MLYSLLYPLLYPLDESPSLPALLLYPELLLYPLDPDSLPE